MKVNAWEKIRSPEQEGIWLISYSDMMTLLLTFFVTLLSIAKVQKHRFEMISAALSQKKTENDLVKLERRVDQWVRDTHMEEKVATDLGPEGLRVQFTNALLFESGKAELTTDGQEITDKFLGMLAQVDPSYRVQIEGYSDDVPSTTRGSAATGSCRRRAPSRCSGDSPIAASPRSAYRCRATPTRDRSSR